MNSVVNEGSYPTTSSVVNTGSYPTMSSVVNSAECSLLLLGNLLQYLDDKTRFKPKDNLTI
jgi:hypothetical protein